MSEQSGDPLVVEGLVKRFGGLTAVDGVDFAVNSGSITGMIGPNGAGKTTTFDCITGVQRPDTGAVYLDGLEITGLPPHRIARNGLVRTFQQTRELRGMTVLENLMLAPQDQSGEQLWRSVLPGARTTVRNEERVLRERVWEILEFFELDHLAEEDAGNLSGGQQKLLELARALLTDPEILLLDEPVAGVNPTLTNKLLDRIHELRDQGYTFLLIEHDMEVIANNCDWVIVLDQGTVLTEGPVEDVLSEEAVIDAYLGT